MRRLLAVLLAILIALSLANVLFGTESETQKAREFQADHPDIQAEAASFERQQHEKRTRALVEKALEDEKAGR